MTDFFTRLMAETETARNELLSIPFVVEGVAGRLGRVSYRAFLTQAYHHVKHTTPLLMSCGSRIPQNQEWLRDAMAHYIQEELGHQEWILNDIAACGGDPEAVRQGEPDVPAELMVAYAYDVIQRRNPLGFLGMVLVLEGTSIHLALEAADHLQQALGLPNQAFSYLRSHGALDQSHMRFYAQLVNRLDTEADRLLIIHTAKVFYRLYGDIFRHLPMLAVNTGEQYGA